MTEYGKLRNKAEECCEKNSTEDMLFFFNKLFEQTIKEKETVELSHGLYSLGVSCRKVGLYNESIKSLKKNLCLTKELKSSIHPSFYYLFTSFSCVELALTYKKLEKYNLSLKYFEAAIPLMKAYERIEHDEGGCNSIYYLFDCISDLYAAMEDEKNSKKYKQIAIDECKHQLYTLMHLEGKVPGDKLFNRLKFLFENEEENSYQHLCFAESLLKSVDNREDNISLDEAKIGKTVCWTKTIQELKSDSYDMAIKSAKKLLIYTKTLEKQDPSITRKDELAYTYYLLAEAYTGSMLYQDAINAFQNSENLYDEIRQEDSSDADAHEMYITIDNKIANIKELLEGTAS